MSYVSLFGGACFLLLGIGLIVFRNQFMTKFLKLDLPHNPVQMIVYWTLCALLVVVGFAFMLSAIGSSALVN